MKKKNNNNRDNIVSISAATGFMIGSALWFWIYFQKDDLVFDKMIIYLFAGLLVGGMIGELIKHLKK